MRPTRLASTPAVALRGSLLLGLMLAACVPGGAPGTLPPPAISVATKGPQVRVAILPGPPLTPTAAIETATEPFELGAGQHLSASGSYTETESEAAGPMMCRIERDSCAFQQLVIVQDPDILWSRGEAPPYDDEDQRVHGDMVGPLMRLKDLVRAEWNGETRLMVTEAYDSLLQHDIAQNDPNRKYSLHFEGRSIDLIVWPPDAQRLARMCALAHQAGFAWVHNEMTHCHASIRAPSLCFACSWKAP